MQGPGPQVGGLPGGAGPGDTQGPGGLTEPLGAKVASPVLVAASAVRTAVLTEHRCELRKGCSEERQS